MTAARRTWIAAVLSLGIVTMVLYGSQMKQALGDPVSCLARVASYVTELDQLLAKERNEITPYLELNKRYTPFEDCDTDALLVEVLRSRFARPITYNPRAKVYFVEFTSKDVRAGFVYLANEKRSETHFALWTNW